MSRSGYTDDCPHLELYRANVDRTIAGKKGQAFLRELIAALEAMPVKRLIAHDLKLCGEVCALGAVGVKRGLDLDRLDPNDPDLVAKAFGISTMLALEVVYQNDERAYPITLEDRWIRMHAWAKKHLL